MRSEEGLDKEFHVFRLFWVSKLNIQDLGIVFAPRFLQSQISGLKTASHSSFVDVVDLWGDFSRGKWQKNSAFQS